MSASCTSAAINSTNPTARLGIQCMAKLIRTDPSLRCLNHDAEHDQNQCSSDRQPERKESRAFVPKERVPIIAPVSEALRTAGMGASLQRVTQVT